MKKLLLVPFFVVFTMCLISCEKDDQEEIEVGVEFTNSQLESLVRDVLNNQSGNILEEDLLTIDTLVAGKQLSSLNEIEKLDNLVFLDILDNEDIKDADVDELKANLSSCTVLHRKYILNSGKYHLLKTIEITQTETSYPEYEYEIIMKGGSDDIMVTVNVYTQSASLAESTIDTDTYTSSTTFDNHSFHPYFSEIYIKDVLDYITLNENETNEVKVVALSDGSFTLSFDGNTKVSYHTDALPE